VDSLLPSWPPPSILGRLRKLNVRRTSFPPFPFEFFPSRIAGRRTEKPRPSFFPFPLLDFFLPPTGPVDVLMVGTLSLPTPPPFSFPPLSPFPFPPFSHPPDPISCADLSFGNKHLSGIASLSLSLLASFLFLCRRAAASAEPLNPPPPFFQAFSFAAIMPMKTVMTIAFPFSFPFLRLLLLPPPLRHKDRKENLRTFLPSSRGLR